MASPAGGAPWALVDIVTAVLGGAALVLTGVAVLVAIVAFWGYRDIRAMAAARAEDEARRVAEDVAAREIRAFLDKQPAGDDITQAYQDEPPAA